MTCSEPAPAAAALTSPAGAGGLAVLADRRRVALTFGTQTVVSSVTVVAVLAIVVALWATVGPVPPFSLAPFAVVLGFQAVLAVSSARQWAQLRRPGPVLVVGPEGLRLRTRAGEVQAPWEAVRSVTVERPLSGPRLRVRLVPDPHPGGAATLSGYTRRQRRVVGRRGLQHGLRVLDVDPATLLDAVRHWSRGRV